MIRWTYAFLDRPAATVDRATAFWASVTDTRASEPWGDEGEFTSLVAEGADTCLVTQAVGGPGGAHPGLAVEDMTAFTGRATELGAVVRARLPELTVLRSPTYQPFCLVPWRGQRSVPPVVTGPGGVRSRADQISLDVSPDAFDAEVGFWVELTGWDASPGEHAEFHVLRPALGLPVHLIVQRLDAPRPASAHLDVACPDLEAGRTWHEAHGAEFVGRGDAWLVMRDPSGGVYCLTRRDPETGE